MRIIYTNPFDTLAMDKIAVKFSILGGGGVGVPSNYICHGVSSHVCVNIRVLIFNVCQIVCPSLMLNWLQTIVPRHIAKDVLIHCKSNNMPPVERC